MRHGLLLLAWILGSPAAAWNDGASTDRDRPIIHALHALGVQYRWGGRSPETGFDCSGLVTHVGRFVHAPRHGAAVRVESAQTPYWRNRFNGGRRLDPPTF